MKCPVCGKGDEFNDVVISERLDDDTFKEWRFSLVWVSFPSGQTGYRFEYFDEDAVYPEDLGTLTIIDGKLVVVNW